MIFTYQEERVRVIELNRPEKKNAFTGAMYNQLSNELEMADADQEVSVIVITGADTAFSAGNDLEDFLNFPPDNIDAPPFHFLKTLANLNKPVIAAVNGMAVGIGATMLSLCDLVYAQDSAKFVFPFISLGLVPEGASSLTLPKLLGHQRASEILYFGEPISAVEAHALGLVNRVITDLPVRKFVLERANQLAKLPMGSILQTKRLLKHELNLSERIDLEAGAFVARTQSSAAKEAFSAFLEKRKPNFVGLD